MKIPSIQQNNNTNFKGLYGSKSALRKLNHSPFKSEVDKLAKNCDVLVKKEADDFWPPFLTAAIGSLTGIIASLSWDLPYGLFVGIASSIVSAIPICNIFSNNTIQIGEKIKKDDKFGGLKFEGVKSEEITLDEKTDLDELEQKYISDILKKGSVEPLKLCIRNGRVNLLDKNSSYLKSRMSKNEYKQIIEAFLQFQLTKDENGNLPLHKIKESSDVTDLHDYFKNNINDLAEIYLTKNNDGELPIHNPNIMEDASVLYNIIKTFENYPRLLVTIFEAKNKQGESVLDVLKKLEGRENQYLIERTLRYEQEAKELCTKKDGVFEPILSKTEREANTKLNNMMTSGVNFQSIMNILKDKDCQDTKGYLLNNSAYITNVIDFILNEASRDEEKAIIEELKKLSNIDYNKVDDNNISVMEKVMNAENSELLKLLGGKKLNYYPELDYAFERIENRDFRKQVEAFNFEFKDLEQATRMKSMRCLGIIEKQFSSPLFKKDYNGKSLLDIADLKVNLLGNDNFSEQFREKYGQYLSYYI